MRPQRGQKVDYQKLAGMSRKSHKSKGSAKSVKSDKTTELVDDQEGVFEDLKEAILKDAEEGLGASIVDTPVPTNIEEDVVFKTTMEAHDEEARRLEEKKMQLHRRQKALDVRKKLADTTHELEALAWQQKLQIKEMEIEDQETCLRLLEKEEHLKQKSVEINHRSAMLKQREQTELKSRDWHKGHVEDGRSAAMELEHGVHGFRDAGLASADTAGGSATDRRVLELEREIQRLKMKEPRAAPCIEQEGGNTVHKLKELGLMPMHVQDDVFSYRRQGETPIREELKKTGLGEQTGKPGLIHITQQCTGCSDSGGEKNKLKLGKYAKTNINIRVQEQWPHMNVLCKYSKRTVFDQLEFDAFVAGETRIIALMQDRKQAQGRLEFLSKIAHWLCRSKDWVLVRGLYEAVVESIELGEDTWTLDFSHYENVLPVYTRVETREREKQDYKKKDKTEIYWCKAYQRNMCNENLPHMMQLKADELPVPIIHCCALCLQKENKWQDHPECECPAKKG